MSAYCDIGVLYGLLNTLPTAICYTDLPCAGTTVLDKGEGYACFLNRASLALLLSLYYWMAAHTTCTFLQVSFLLPFLTSFPSFLPSFLCNLHNLNLPSFLPFRPSFLLLPPSFHPSKLPSVLLSFRPS